MIFTTWTSRWKRSTKTARRPWRRRGRCPRLVPQANGRHSVLNRDTELPGTRLGKLGNAIAMRAILVWSCNGSVTVSNAFKKGIADRSADRCRAQPWLESRIDPRALTAQFGDAAKTAQGCRPRISAYERTKSVQGRARMQRHRWRQLRQSDSARRGIVAAHGIVGRPGDEMGRINVQIRTLNKQANQTGRSRRPARPAIARDQGTAQQDARDAGNAGADGKALPASSADVRFAISICAAIWPRATFAWSCRLPRSIAAAACRSPT